ncbi:MAG: MEDS domain-containing protein [Nitrosotalea sp.]
MKNKAKKTNLGFKFIDNEVFGNHLLMLYENADRGFAAKLRYLNNGLLKGERAIFLTYEDPKDIEDKMSGSIDVEKFRKNDLLHILQIQEKISNSGEALKQFEEVIKLMESSPRAGFRLTGPFIGNTSDKNGKKLRLLIEKRSQLVLSKHKGSILCPHQIVKARDSYEKEWMLDMLKEHSDVLYVPKSSQATSFSADFI